MYRVIYEPTRKERYDKRWARRVVLTGTVFALFCIVVYFCFPEGRKLLQLLLIPGDPDATLQAAEVFSAELGSGYAITDAVRNFCNAVLENGYPG